MGGGARRPDEADAREHMRAMAAAGATWWIEWIAPCRPEDAIRQVQRGPIVP
jgi:hypothetical protein